MRRVAVISSDITRRRTLELQVKSAIETLALQSEYAVDAYSTPLSTLGHLESMALFVLYANEQAEQQESLNKLGRYASEERIELEEIYVPLDADDTTVKNIVRAGLHLDMESNL